MALSLADEFWQKFIESTGTDPESRCSGDINFESKGFNNDAQIAMILTGQKTATFSSLASYNIDGEPLPVTGELYMVFDRGDNPRAIIEIESVNIVPFNEVTWSMAQQEGEDENLEMWREKEREYLEEEGSIVGFDFVPDMKLIFQTFKVVYK